MPIRLTSPYRNFGNVDLKRASDVRFDKVIPHISEPPPVLCLGLTGRLPFELNASNDLINDVVTTDFFVTGLPIDVNDYPGLVAAWFQLTVDTLISAVDSQTVDLVDELGTVYATIVVPPLTPYVTLMPLAAFTPVGAHLYMVRIRASAVRRGIVVHGARIYLDLVASQRATIQIPLMGNSASLGASTGDPLQNNIGSYAMDVNNNVLNFSNVGVRPPAWLKETAKWATIVKWTTEIIGRVSVNGLTGSFALRQGDEVTGPVVADSRIDVTATTPTLYRRDFLNGAADFIDGGEFLGQYRFVNPDFESFNVYRTALYVTLECDLRVGAMHAQIFNRVGATCFDTTANVGNWFVGARFPLDLSKYPLGTVWFYESTSKQFGGSDGDLHYALWDGGLNDTGDAGAEVAASQVVFATAGFRTRQRSGALVLTSGNRYMGFNSLEMNKALALQAVQFLIAEV